VFTDPQNKVIFVTENFGKNIKSFNLNFLPSEVSFHEDEPQTFLVYDKMSPVKGVSFRFLHNLQLGFHMYVYICMYVYVGLLVNLVVGMDVTGV
jgi:hypothetical protein